MCKEDCGLGDIYCLKNRETEKVYIGQAIHWMKKRDKLVLRGGLGRVKEHLRKALSKTTIDNTHPKLYDAIRKYGKDKFGWCILETCKISMLNDRETYWIEQYDSVNNGYNMVYKGSSSHGSANTEKLSESIKELWNNEEYREKQTLSHVETWKTKEYRDNYNTAIRSRKKKTGLPHNIYEINKKDTLVGYEVTIKRNKKNHRKVFSNSAYDLPTLLEMAIAWRDQTLKQLE